MMMVYIIFKIVIIPYPYTYSHPRKVSRCWLSSSASSKHSLLSKRDGLLHGFLDVFSNFLTFFMQTGLGASL